MIRHAALVVDPEYGRISSLAKMAGLRQEAIRKAIRIGKFSTGMAAALELAVGAEVLSREMLCPEKFAK